MSEFLTPDEVRDLTRRTWYRKQIEALVQMGLEFQVRPDGSPVVPRAQFRVRRAEGKEWEIDWNAQTT